MTAELKRYDLFATGPDYDAFFSDIVETPEGKYVRFADVEAYTQAAIAAKNAQIIDLIEALRRRTDGEICGCGVDNPTDVCLSHYDVIEAVVRNRVQAAIAAAMMGAVKLADGIAGNTKDYDREHRRAAGQIGALIKASISTDAAAALGAALLGAYKEGWSDGAANCHHDRNETPDDGWLISDTYKSIPTDATAALEERDKQVRDEVLESAAVIAAKEGVYPELNVWNDGPDWYQHGKRIAAAIRAMKGGA